MPGKDNFTWHPPFSGLFMKINSNEIYFLYLCCHTHFSIIKYTCYKERNKMRSFFVRGNPLDSVSDVMEYFLRIYHYLL